MQTIKLLSKDLEQLGELTEYVSLMFTRSWHEVGDFQLVIHREANLANEIQKDCLIALNKNKVAIVKHREIQLDQNGKATENWLFRGWTLKGLMDQRITVPPTNLAYDNKSGNAETVMKHYIDKHFVNPVDPKRKMPNLVIAPNQNRGRYVNWQSRFKIVAEELTEISLASDIGWDITLDTKNNQFVFEVFEGMDRSVNQNERSNVYFSPEFGNVKTQSFTDSDINKRNVGYVGGQGEGVEREIIELGDAEGFERYETFIDARDIEDSSQLPERGQQKLNEMKNEMFFESQIMSPNGVEPFVYEKDYFLGDIVTIMNREWGFIVDRRIAEITEIYEAGGFRLDAVFGQSRPTLIEKLKRKFNELDNVLKQ
ncbi:siphovirus ReqiPepy6 Gp37-like family protein [Paucisalibacillus globulus]|uniref:siphovirus ReqiPepy6 Gp37-like family protein n=1 Tax=Paucisalibacillus globulus TaxID=351095 RepID=UPI00047C0B07|nr:siphovirus ReqiPepy6 Gp37-like family protein [Paucisalibacillus globulus]